MKKNSLCERSRINVSPHVGALLAVLGLLAMLLVPAAIQADSGSTLDIQSMEADSIVVGTVQQKSSNWNEEHTRIETSLTVSVEDELKGNIDSRTITIEVPGGEVNGIRQEVTNTPTFTRGERMLVFLENKGNNRFRIQGNNDGKFTLEGDKIANSRISLGQIKQKILNQENVSTILSDPGFDAVVVGSPVISGISPGEASAGTGTQVTISGSGFGSSQGGVEFFYRNGQPYIPGSIQSWSDTSIDVVVPVGVVNGYAGSASSGNVVVKNQSGSASAPYPFSVTFGYGGMKWPGVNPVVNFYINANTSDTTGEDLAVRNAAATWNSVPGTNFQFSYAGTSTATGYGYNHKNEIMWSNMGSTSILGVAAYWYSGDTMLECDIQFNDYFTWSTGGSGVDVESIALHELGHWLSLRDLYGNLSGYPQDTAKVMYGFGGTLKRNLSPQDIAGIQYIYPGSSIQNSIRLTSPNGGESWETGSSHPIGWTYTGQPGSTVRIELLKAGNSVQTISQNYPVGSSGSGSYNWSINNSTTAGSDYRIRVTCSDESCTDVSNGNFSITPPEPDPVVAVTSPNGGEEWTAGTTQTISWSYEGNPGNYVRIDLLKNGLLNSTLTSSRALSYGYFNWTVPAGQTAGSDYQIRISSTTLSGCSDTSDANFAILAAEPPGITLAIPNGGEVWNAGTAQEIRWDYTGNPGSYVRIELYKAGILNRTIASSALIANKRYLWTVPAAQPSGNDYRVNIRSTSNSAYSDISDSTFSINGAPAPEIMVTSPNGGEEWTAGTTQTISWSYEGNPGNYVRIDLLKNGLLNSTLTSSRALSYGYFNWTVPAGQTAGSDYQIRISSTTLSGCSDSSDANFAILAAEPPGITLAIPNGGEVWNAGTAQEIRWDYTGNPGSYVRIELYKAGILNRTIASSASITNKRYLWTVPAAQPSGNDYKVNIRSTGNSAYSDISDSTFSINGAPAPEIMVTSPNGGEEWTAGTANQITWTYTGNPGNYVRIELLKNGDLYRTLITSRALSYGYYNWTVPAGQTPGDDYQVRVSSTTLSGCGDTSDSPFTIAGPLPPGITLTIPNGGEVWDAGTAQEIRWDYTGNPGYYVRIELYKAGILNRTIASSVRLANKQYTWSVPVTQISGNDYTVKIRSTGNAAYSDFSDSEFTIEGAPSPEITVTAPNGGEEWEAGTVQKITWDHSGNPGNYLKIELLKNGTIYRTITGSTPVSRKYFNWSIPSSQPAGTDYSVRVSSTVNPLYNDTSDTEFSIIGQKPPEITLTIPNGGEIWHAGEKQLITWTYSGNPGSYLRIDLYKGGVYNRAISSYTPVANRAFSWSIPATQSSGNDYSIRISSRTYSACYDSSDAVFSILGVPQPEITLTSPNGTVTVAAGSQYMITWQYTGTPGNYVRIELYKDGVYNRIIASYLPIASNAYLWTVPVTLSGNGYSIKIKSTTNSAIYDLSDSEFSIY